ncbi:hypothetical protein ACOGYP_001822 [Edwardsiella piscicida]|nr:hypothetical protein [Edwardsiella piscicida]
MGAFAAVAQCHPLGFDLLLARYREDRQAEQRARRADADLGGQLGFEYQPAISIRSVQC